MVYRLIDLSNSRPDECTCWHHHEEHPHNSVRPIKLYPTHSFLVSFPRPRVEVDTVLVLPTFDLYNQCLSLGKGTMEGLGGYRHVGATSWDLNLPRNCSMRGSTVVVNGNLSEDFSISKLSTFDKLHSLLLWMIISGRLILSSFLSTKRRCIYTINALSKTISGMDIVLMLKTISYK